MSIYYNRRADRFDLYLTSMQIDVGWDGYWYWQARSVFHANEPIVYTQACMLCFRKGKTQRHFLLGKGHSMRKLRISIGAFQGHHGNDERAQRQSPLLPLRSIRPAICGHETSRYILLYYTSRWWAWTYMYGGNFLLWLVKKRQWDFCQSNVHKIYQILYIFYRAASAQKVSKHNKMRFPAKASFHKLQIVTGSSSFLLSRKSLGK